jgi:agmatinase
MKTLGVRNNFLAIEAKHSALERAAIAVVSAPYERTTSCGKGTRLGPRAILNASAFVEFYDDEFDRELVFDVGIATLAPVKFGKLAGAKALALIRTQVDALLQQGKFVVTLGGEHTISLAPITAHLSKYPNLSVLHFDAHSDLRQAYEGSPYSHASVMARVIEHLDPRRLVQVGIRAQCIEESRLIREKGINTFYASQMYNGSMSDWQDRVVECLTDEVYVSFDLDALDPAILPATGTPEPNGMFWPETMSLLRKVGGKKRIVGCDVVELAPPMGPKHSEITAAKLTYKLMNYGFLRR